MDNKFTNQEEQLRALSEDFTLDIDTSELWGKVEAELPPVEDDKRRPIIWWFASGALIIAVSLFAWNYNSKLKDLNPVTPNNSKPIANVEKSTTNTTTIDNKHTKNLPANKIQNTPNSSSQKLNAAISPQLNPPTHQPANSSSHQPADPSIHQFADNKKVNIPAIFNSNRYDEKSKSWKEEEIGQSPTVHSIETLIDPSTDQNMENLESEIVSSRNLLSYDLLESISLNSLVQESKIALVPQQIEPIKITKWLPYFALTSGVNMHSNNYSITNKELDLSQFDSERPLLGLSSDLRFGFENNKGWRLGFGLSHSRLVNRYTGQSTVISTEEIVGINEEKIDDEGNSIFTDGSLSLTTITNHNLRWHRTHDFIDAELLIGRQVFEIGNFALFANVGISKNIWSRHTGYYYTQDSELITQFLHDEENPYSSGGYNAGLSMDLEYKINKISICLRPFTRFGLNNITENSNYYQIKNSQYGVQLGVVYRP